MKPNDINPPGIVRTAVSELVATGKAINAAIRQGERMTLAKAIELGKIVNQLIETCDHGALLKAYSDIGVSQQRASDYGRIAKLPHVVLSRCESIHDAKKAVQEEASGETDSGGTSDGEQATSTVQQPLAGSIPAPSNPRTTNSAPASTPVVCERCRRVGGAGRRDCAACAELRGKKKPGEARHGTAGPLREPGDDSAVIAAEEAANKKTQAENGRACIDWKAADEPLGKLIRAVDRWYTDAGLKRPDGAIRRDAAYHEWNRKVHDVVDTLKSIYQHVQQHAQKKE